MILILLFCLSLYLFASFVLFNSLLIVSIIVMKTLQAIHREYDDFIEEIVSKFPHEKKDYQII